MERRFGIKEQFAFNLKVGLSLVALGIWQFSADIKRDIRKAQDHRCADCGEHKFLQIHHRVPENAFEHNHMVRGKNIKENGVGLCPEDHLKWDRLAIEQDIIFPGIPFERVPKRLYQEVKKI